MPRVCRLLAGVASVLACGVAMAQNARDELPVWIEDRPRPMVVQGPTGATRLAPRRMAVAEPNLSEAVVQTPALPSQAVVDGAIRQATFYSPTDTASLPVSDRGAADAIESSPSDDLLPEPAPLASLPKPAPLKPVAAEALKAASAAPSHEPFPATSTHASGPRLALPTEPARRLLAPRSASVAGESTSTRRPFADYSWEQITSESLATVGAALAVVLGLVFLMAWVWRRAAPRSSRPLPADVVEVIGRAPLAGKQVAQLIKIGGKLVLVCVTPEGVKPITEVNDPQEVTRLLGLCEQSHDRSASAAFQEVFDQITREPAGPGFLGDEAPLFDRQKLADAYANTPGGRAYA